jgi:hypothetical protein
MGKKAKKFILDNKNNVNQSKRIINFIKSIKKNDKKNNKITPLLGDRMDINYYRCFECSSEKADPCHLTQMGPHVEPDRCVSSLCCHPAKWVWINKKKVCPSCGNPLEHYFHKFWGYILGACLRCTSCGKKWTDKL